MVIFIWGDVFDFNICFVGSGLSGYVMYYCVYIGFFLMCFGYMF